MSENMMDITNRVVNLILEETADLRASLAASQAEVERLRGIIRKVEWCVVVLGKDWSDGHHQCPICECALSEGHDEECPFYQWEGGEK